MVHFTRACKTLLSENNKTRLTFEKQQEKNKNIICRPWSVRIEKNCALGLEHGPRPAVSGRTQDLWHSFSQYGPPGRQIIYISFTEKLHKTNCKADRTATKGNFIAQYFGETRLTFIGGKISCYMIKYFYRSRKGCKNVSHAIK